ncbi:ABC transporter permease [Facklamia lactis]|uniref:ABC transporter permease n=1 Tax=Facklamia lactis TaxID=2749967 RepID=UPI0018CDCDEF|nr:ABC transporter permease [Facklamia lactis]MBG9980343.1 ABC transporter permease [Facklamia lactis]
MINSLKADLFRLFKSRGFYLTLFILMLHQLMVIINEAVGSIGIVSDASPEEASHVIDNIIWTAEVAVKQSSHTTSLLIYLGLPLFVMIIGFDLVRSTYKNILTIGISRTEYFLSKLMIFAFVLVLEIVTYYTIAFLIGGIRNGWGELDSNFWSHFGQVLSFQYINILAIFSLSMVVLYWLFSNVGAVIVAVASPIILAIMAMFLQKDWLAYFNFQTNIDQAWSINLQTSFWQNSMFYPFVTFLVASVLSLILFKRKPL